MAETVESNLKLFGAPKATSRDVKAAKKLGAKPNFATSVDRDSKKQSRASSDEDAVSWLAPFGRFSMACWTKGIQGHHRETSAHSVLPFAHLGMRRAAEVIAGSIVDLVTEGRILRKAMADFRTATKGFKYDPLVPRKQKPPLARQ